jgi:hypothetical protein
MMQHSSESGDLKTPKIKKKIHTNQNDLPSLNSSVKKIEVDCLANIIEENQEEDFVTDNLLSNLDSLKPIK